MTDVFSKEKRSEIMGKIRAKNSKPELFVRKMIRSIGFGYGYRLHRKDLPGKPDLAFISLKRAIFVNGCFWHGHKGCKNATTPRTNTDFWREKIARNIRADIVNREKLRLMGWESLTLWECEIKKGKTRLLKSRISEFLGKPKSKSNHSA